MIIATFDENYNTPSIYGRLWQYDYGQILRIQGLDLPSAVEIHFSLEDKGVDSITRIGVTKDSVTNVIIPDSILENGDIANNYYIYAFIYLRNDESGETIKKIRMTVKARPKPEGYNSEDSTMSAILKIVNSIADEKADGLKYEDNILSLIAGEKCIASVTITGGSITPEQISEAVKGYLASNPIKETDPTVPAWAKEEAPDKSLTQEGKAADAKEVGDRLDELSNAMTNAGSGMTATVKNALLNCFVNVAWANEDGQTYYNALQTALNESVGEIKLSSITAICSETAQIGTAASDLDIVVTAVYSDGSSAQVTGWTTSGTVVEGTNTFMVSYGGKNTTVTVTGVNAVAVTLENYTKSVTQLKSTTYTDDGNTPVASSGQWYINTTSGAFIQSTPLDEDVTVNISCIPDTACYNGAWVGQVDDGYGLVPSGENAAQTNVYYYKSIASQMLVDTEYSLSNYTIKSGYRLIWNSGGKNTVTPTVEVVS